MKLPCAEPFILSREDDFLAQAEGHARLHKCSSEWVIWFRPDEKHVRVLDILHILLPEDWGEGLWPDRGAIAIAMVERPAGRKSEFTPLEGELPPEWRVVEAGCGVDAKVRFHEKFFLLRRM